MKKIILNLSKKQIVLAICIVLMSVITVGSTMALLNAVSNSVVNTFERADMSCEIVETFDGTTKSNVYITNTSTEDSISGYIRVAVIVSWQDVNGNIYGKQPIPGIDYEITYGSEWEKTSDGYYYWPIAVAAGDKTGILIDSCSEVDGMAPDGYTLVVDVIAEIIQSNPEDAVEDAWGYVPGRTGGQ